MASTNQKSTGKKRGRPAKKKAPEPEMNKAWSIALFGAGAVLFALTWVKGATAWNTVSGLLFSLFGVTTYFIAPLVWYLAVLVAVGRPVKAKFIQGALTVLLVSGCAMVFSKYTPTEGNAWWRTLLELGTLGKSHAGGGYLAVVAGLPLLLFCGRPAANIIIVVLIAVFLMLLTNVTPVDIYAFFRSRCSDAKTKMSAYEETAAQRQAERQQARQEAQAAAPVPAAGSAKKKIDISLDGKEGLDVEKEATEGPADYGAAPMPAGCDLSSPPAEGESGFAYDLALEGDMQSATPLTPAVPASQLAPELEAKIKKIVSQSPWEEGTGVYTELEHQPHPAEPIGTAAPAAEQSAGAAAGATPTKPVVDPVTGQVMLPPGAPGQNSYRYPPLSLFEKSKSAKGGADENELKRNADLLVSTLSSFGVETRLLDISRGPSVTRYELQPAAGVKISRITGLADDIALNLAAAGVRIEAPIPGKAAVGIEVPNKHASAVDMYSILSSQTYKTTKSPIAIPLGKDIAGAVQLADLTKMPHLLIAGSTGSGKSVCINAIITSILYHSSPDEVKMMLIDPKVVELSDYNGVPHLLMPVVTEARKAAGALGSQVAEMERRYQLFAANNVRDIKTYNRLAENDETMERLPYIAIVIDELADLMMVCGKEVEDYICRIAQKARAAGMHLIVATQRPSVDVITGLIKANIPSRIAFAVSSQVDSRTILDGAGAEKLLGMGDMLFMPVGANKPIRIQGTYVKDEEIASIIDFVKQDTPAQYNEGMIADMEKMATSQSKGNAAGDTEDSEAHDPMLKAAIDTVVEAGQASTSLLQRRLKLGYARAARIMDTMEELHVIGPSEGAKPRAVLITRQQYLEMFANTQPGVEPAQALPDEPPFPME